jgi:hypothetical protein
MKNSADTVSAKEQNRLVDAWSAQRPPPPETKRPKTPKSAEPIFGIAIPLFFVGGAIGFGISIAIGQVAPGWALLIFLASPFVIGLGIPIGACFIIDLVQDVIYSRAMNRTGWAQYDEDVRTWRLIGDEDFGHWSEKNEHVMYTLAWGQPDPLRHLPPLTSDDVAHAMGMKVPKRKTEPDSSEASTVPDEFDALERYLDGLPEAPRHDLSLPSGWRMRWTARGEARRKAVAVARSDRYIEEVRFPAYRALSAVGGWVSTGASVTPAERVAIAKQIRPHFERYGLKVTNVLLMWRGMSNGEGGSYESFDLAVRLA